MVRQILVLVLQLVVSVLVTIWPDWGRLEFTKADEVLLGSSLFVAFLLLDILWVTSRLAARNSREDSLWIIRDECDTHLRNISQSYARLLRDAYGSSDLFVGHFRSAVRRLEQSITEVAESRRLRVQADHFLNVDNVLDAFQGDSELIWRYTWDINDGSDRLFDELAWRRYFERTADMVRGGQIKEVRTILVLDDANVTSAPRIEALLRFFRTHSGFSCCTVLKEDFRTLCNDSDVPGKCIDFGIYGRRLLFLTEQYEPSVTGVFTKDQALIERFCRLFDSMWGSPSVAKPNPNRGTDTVTLEELYALDESLGSGAAGS